MQLRRVTLMASNNFPNTPLRSEIWTLVSDLQSVGFLFDLMLGLGSGSSPGQEQVKHFHREPGQESSAYEI